MVKINSNDSEFAVLPLSHASFEPLLCPSARDMQHQLQLVVTCSSHHPSGDSCVRTGDTIDTIVRQKSAYNDMQLPPSSR